MEKEEIINDCCEESRVNSQESSVATEENTDTIYDISDVPESSKKSVDPDSPADSKPSETSDISDPAKTEIENMISEIGADTLLQIIKGNRNAAIEQIIKEVEAAHDSSLPSGSSSAPSCTSIFDLAAMA